MPENRKTAEPVKGTRRGKTDEESDTAVKNIETIMALEAKAVRERTTGQHFADRITKFAGSSPFIMLHIFWFGVWIIGNTGLVPHLKTFDPFPFSFLTLVVSLEAIFLTLLVLMSQNRMTKEADKRAHLDLQINMLAEQESTLTLRTVQKIAEHLGLTDLGEVPMPELLKDTDIEKLASALDEKAKV